ncbi:SIR2 family protein [Flavobacterium anhuiense]|uniref:SIR2 family protein n=1 Tax=Flavobacterium anhuiense TaxID=459526 RepID=UPI002025DF43|nr:SIR2 family protein [Flavobacterium anhuiense]URM36379.1 SIR2 family protein [Flavobacterium anhuiense]
MSNYTTSEYLSKEKIEEAFRILNNAKTKSDFINNLPKSKVVSRKQIIKELIEHYEKEKLVFVLGAGVSMSFGLPNWDTLLQKLMITTIEKEQNVSTVLSKLFTNVFSPSPLIAGRYLQKFYDDKKLSFENAVRKVLYAEIDINKKSLLMDEIINFCVSPGKSPNLDSIITYNFDDILEQRLAKVGVEVPHKPIYGIGMNPDGQLPIFHVHGFLQQNGELTDQNQITFGELVYHKQYIDIYSWNNIVQINKFRDSNCLFIGSSLTDPNTRRLLDIAKKQNGENEGNHYIFKMRHKESIVKIKLQSLLKENKELLGEKSSAELNFDETVKFLIEIIERFEESDTASFGVKTIWIDKWDDIPEIMQEVRLRKK